MSRLTRRLGKVRIGLARPSEGATVAAVRRAALHARRAELHSRPGGVALAPWRSCTPDGRKLPRRRAGATRRRADRSLGPRSLATSTSAPSSARSEPASVPPCTRWAGEASRHAAEPARFLGEQRRTAARVIVPHAEPIRTEGSLTRPPSDLDQAHAQRTLALARSGCGASQSAPALAPAAVAPATR
jgi:hypothetical protein